ncbi:MAG: MBL fold metallo-hydrolase [Verrucomicrobiota bacterium]
MSLTFRILGVAGGDNALLVQIDSGHAVERLLFDCGEGCVSELPFADIQAIDHLFFSHFHMDHVGGFDAFFRSNFNRANKPNRIWGPPESGRILQHRFQGFLWNLHEEMSATWRVVDIYPGQLRTARFELREAFAILHEEGMQPYERILWENAHYSIEAVTMDHRTPTLAYIVREKARRNIDTSRMASLGLRPGPWLKQLKESSTGPGEVTIAGRTYSFEELRGELITETPGESVAYLTDFLLDEPAMDELAKTLSGCETIICEGQYRHADLELARRHFHMTTVLSATLAQRAQVGELVLFHLSSRYRPAEWREMLEEARRIFPKTRYPEQWQLDSCAQADNAGPRHS